MITTFPLLSRRHTLVRARRLGCVSLGTQQEALSAVSVAFCSSTTTAHPQRCGISATAHCRRQSSAVRYKTDHHEGLSSSLRHMLKDVLHRSYHAGAIVMESSSSEVSPPKEEEGEKAMEHIKEGEQASAETSKEGETSKGTSSANEGGTTEGSSTDGNSSETGNGSSGDLSGESTLVPAHVEALSDELLQLNMMEIGELMDNLREHYGFEEEASGEGAGGEEDDDEGGQSGEEKTAFDIKLVGFDAKSKIKIIKEVRCLASLGLKEAKELVDGAPSIIQKDLSKETAEETKAKLEELGAQVEIV